MKRTSGRIGVGLVLGSTLVGACFTEREQAEVSVSAGPSSQLGLAPDSEAKEIVRVVRAQLDRAFGVSATSLTGTEVASRGIDALRAFDAQTQPTVELLGLGGISDAAGKSAARVTLPAHADGTFQLHDETTGMAIEVGLVGATPSARENAGGYVVYRGGYSHGAHIIHRPSAKGTEDYVFFPDKLPETPELQYKVSLRDGVVGLRLVSNTLEMLDAGGAPRLRMASPYAVDANGRRLEMQVAIDGCAYDASTAIPLGRPMVDPGARECTVRLTWPADAKAPLLVDPVWSHTGDMAVVRFNATSAQLPVNLFKYRVIVVGGDQGAPSSALATSEIFDEATNTWMQGPPMSGGPRTEHAMVAFYSGNTFATYYVIGGRNSGGAFLKSMEKLKADTAQMQPLQPSFGFVGDMTNPRARPAALGYEGGRIIVTGGTGPNGPVAPVDLYDSALGGWQNPPAPGMLPKLLTPRVGHTMVALPPPDGVWLKALVIGGSPMGGAPVGTLERCDQVVGMPVVCTNIFDAGVPLATHTPRANHVSFFDPTSALVHVIGGDGLDSVETYNPATNMWDDMALNGHMSSPRAFFTATWVPSQMKYLVVGGENAGTVLGTTELYDASTKMFSKSPSLMTPRSRHTATILTDGRPLVIGGAAGNKGSAETLHCEDAGDCNDPALYCTNLGICKPLKPLGFDCDLTMDCWGGQCKTDVCANSYCASDGKCTALKMQGAACDQVKDCSGPMCVREVCASKHCVDGLCCDKACNDQCVACDTMDAPGMCVPITGDPHGSRTPCMVGKEPDDASCGGFCNGVDKVACEYPNNTVCGTACDKGTFTTLSCDGKGSCTNKVSTTSCGVYTCKDTDVCNTGCAMNTECAEGFVCNAMTSTCISSPTTCSSSIMGGEQDQVTLANGMTVPCEPFKCTNNACLVVCNTAYDCLTGYVCNEAGTCVKPVADPDGTGEETCSTSPARESSRFGWLAALAIAGAFAARRRRASA